MFETTKDHFLPERVCKSWKSRPMRLATNSFQTTQHDLKLPFPGNLTCRKSSSGRKKRVGNFSISARKRGIHGSSDGKWRRKDNNVDENMIVLRIRMQEILRKEEQQNYDESKDKNGWYGARITSGVWLKEWDCCKYCWWTLGQAWSWGWLPCWYIVCLLLWQWCYAICYIFLRACMGVRILLYTYLVGEVDVYWNNMSGCNFVFHLIFIIFINV